jgi:hypothetical protein
VPVNAVSARVSQGSYAPEEEKVRKKRCQRKKREEEKVSGTD